MARPPTRKRSRRSKKQTNAAQSTDIDAAPPPTRHRELLADRASLLAKIGRKKRELTRFLDEIRTLSADIARRVEPMMQHTARLDQAIHSIFEELLARREQSKRTRRTILGVYRDLQQSEMLSQEGEGWRGDDDFPPPFDHAATERHHGRAAGRDLRALYLALAERLHPDKTRDEHELSARTEAMQEVNRAYRAGDLARLLELDAQWSARPGAGEAAADEAPSAPAPGRDEIDGRCRELARTNTLLETQLDELRRELRLVRATPQGEMVIEHRRLVRDRDPDPIEVMLGPLEDSIEALEQIHDFIARYRDGEMSLAAFLRGPRPSDPVRDEDPDQDGLDLDAAIELLRTLERAVERERSRRDRTDKRGPPGKRRK